VHPDGVPTAVAIAVEVVARLLHPGPDGSLRDVEQRLVLPEPGGTLQKGDPLGQVSAQWRLTAAALPVRDPEDVLATVERADVSRFDLEDLVGPETVEAEREREMASRFVLDDVEQLRALVTREPDPEAVFRVVGSGLHQRHLKKLNARRSLLEHHGFTFTFSSVVDPQFGQ